jgi:tetraacyldisaccharide 4'-kinase
VIPPSTFYDLVSGRRRGPSAAMLRGVLQVAEVPYRSVVAWRNRRYDRGANGIHRANAPVVSVGNLTVGGTGKTPLVKWIARRFRNQGVRVAILSRGYGAPSGLASDEAKELELDLPDVPHLQNPDRVAAARVAVEDLDAKLLLLDDGFQHRRLHRDVDIVLLDALEPFGYGHLLPRGTLREPCAALRRADVVVLSRADLIDESARCRIRERVAKLAPLAAWSEIRHAPSVLVSASGERRPWQELAGQGVAAFCGIGNPAGFRATLDSCGFTVSAWREFADHHVYRRDDISELESLYSRLGIAAVLCTQKDLVKIQLAHVGGLPLWALSIETCFVTGEDELVRRLDAAAFRH